MSGESFAPELFWLALTCLLAGVIWMPYIVDRIMVRGMMPALGYEGPDANPHSAWTVRLVAAHKNLIEKLVIFGPVVIALIITGQTGIGTAVAAMIFFLPGWRMPSSWRRGSRCCEYWRTRRAALPLCI